MLCLGSATRATVILQAKSKERFKFNIFGTENWLK